MARMPVLAGAVAVAAALVASGCGGPSSSGSSGGGGGTGDFTYVQGKDSSGHLPQILAQWNSAHPKEKVKLLELSDQADAQRASMVQNFQARNSAYDVVSVDVVWTAEFAARGWLAKLDKSQFALDTFLKPTIEPAMFNGALYAAPVTSDGGMLYYRKDLVPTAPKTWAELIADCAIAKKNNMNCYAGQFAQYEGLTVNASEAINSTGGEILKNDGKDVAVDTPEARKGLDFLVNGFKQGYIPKEAITYKEEESRRAFQSGKLLFLRNWPYVYGLANTAGPDSKIVGKFAVAPLPGPDGVGASTLGGHSAAISKFSKKQKSATKFLKWLTSPAIQKQFLSLQSNAPVIASVYDDPGLVKQFPYLPVLKQSIENAKSRPVTPNYNAVTLAIEKNVYEALQGRKSTDQAISDMAKDLKQAISGT